MKYIVFVSIDTSEIDNKSLSDFIDIDGEIEFVNTFVVTTNIAMSKVLTTQLKESVAEWIADLFNIDIEKIKITIKRGDVNIGQIQ